MSLASIGQSMICLQCGESLRRDREFCARCGSPVTNCHVLRHPIRVSNRAKLVVRAGVFGIGLISFFCGLILSYGGWLDPQAMDIIQIWLSRVSGPALIIQGLVYCYSPFRRPAAKLAAVIPFPSDRARSVSR